MFHIVLFEPEIPPNTGNIIRLCANTGAVLHLIEPLGFTLNDAKLKRAGLDYREWADIKIHSTFEDFRHETKPMNIYACSTKGSKFYSEVFYQRGDALIFGPESRGLPSVVLKEFDDQSIIKIPMQTQSRSLNLSNAVSIILYEAWRQLQFEGATEFLPF
ncbi:MAG: tRNA (uridine(34)/cytosine(34)/5-carboxymethylaminomethyluridine(34)-2'-O)-methyltransferase TrmL [Gammaproteobacteria bacterium]|nr:tRNA (uridine(34)/cytosine(34)/5-carboxymethylaminomethyluridine(34)-2'-O)-methyltransferase TrmL [Gammaproteobacteria bacterium]